MPTAVDYAKDIRDLILTDGPTAALIGTRLYVGYVAEGYDKTARTEALVMEIEDGDESATGAWATLGVGFECYGPSLIKARVLARTLKDFLHQKGRTTQGSTIFLSFLAEGYGSDEQDPDVDQLYFIDVSYTIRAVPA